MDLGLEQKVLKIIIKKKVDKKLSETAFSISSN